MTANTPLADLLLVRFDVYSVAKSEPISTHTLPHDQYVQNNTIKVGINRLSMYLVFVCTYDMNIIKKMR